MRLGLLIRFAVRHYLQREEIAALLGLLKKCLQSTLVD